MEQVTLNTIDSRLETTTTEKYRLVKTKELVEKLEAKGFVKVDFVANKVKKAERNGYQKHRVIFEHKDLKSEHRDGKVQLLLTNSHDGSSSVEFRIGFFRIVCSNGLVVGTNLFAPIRLQHKGNKLEEKLENAIACIFEKVQKLDDQLSLLKAKSLTNTEILELQEKCLKLKINPDVKIKTMTFPIKRDADNGKDLFTVMNVIQEGLIRGGAYYVGELNNSPVTRRIRPTRSIVAQTFVNESIWNEAMRMVS